MSTSQALNSIHPRKLYARPSALLCISYFLFPILKISVVFLGSGTDADLTNQFHFSLHEFRMVIFRHIKITSNSVKTLLYFFHLLHNHKIIRSPSISNSLQITFTERGRDVGRSGAENCQASRNNERNVPHYFLPSPLFCLS